MVTSATFENGLINHEGEMILPYEYISLISVSSSQILAIRIDQEHDMLDTMTIDKQQEFIRTHSIGMVYNKNLKPILELEFSNPLRKKLGKEEYIDENGNFLPSFFELEGGGNSAIQELQAIIDSVRDPYETIEKSGKKGIFYDGKKRLPISFDEISFETEFVKVENRKAQDFIMKHYAAHPLKAPDLPNCFYIHYFLVSKNRKAGIYTLTGKEIVKPQYNIVMVHEMGIEVTAYYIDGVTTCSNTGLVTFEGSWLVPLSNHQQSYYDIGNDRMVVVEYDCLNNLIARYSLLDDKGKEIIPFERYDEIGSFWGLDNTYLASQYAIVSVKNGQDRRKTGLIDKDGNEILATIYYDLTFFDDDKKILLFLSNFNLEGPKEWQIYDVIDKTFSLVIIANNISNTVQNSMVLVKSDTLINLHTTGIKLNC